MSKLKISAPPFPNREEYPFTASVRYRGMIIDIENLDGSVREGTDPNGKAWKTPFEGCHYGEIRGSLGTDGDKLDVYIKSNPDDGANKAYIVHQNFPRTHPTKGGQYDEDKVILGVSSLEKARELYLKHYDRKDFLRSITEMPIEAFKRAAFGENKGEKVAEQLRYITESELRAYGRDPEKIKQAAKNIAGTDISAKAKQIGESIGIDWSSADFPVEEFQAGLKVEREHGSALGKDTDVGGDKDSVAGRIAWAHLKELPDYYTRLHKMEVEGEEAKKKTASSTFIRQKLREGGTPMNIEAIKAAACKTPGEKIRSGGKGRGMATGDGKGPRGVPIGAKGTADDESSCDDPGNKTRSKGKGRGLAQGRGHGPMGIPIGEKSMSGEEKDMSKKSEVTEAYEAGAQAALDEYLKEAAQKGFQTVLQKLPGSPPVMGAIPAPPKVSAPGGVKTAQGSAPALGLNPGGGYGPFGGRGLPSDQTTMAVAGNATLPTSYADQVSGASMASPQTSTITPAAQPSVQQTPSRKPQPMVAAAGGVPQIPIGS